MQIKFSRRITPKKAVGLLILADAAALIVLTVMVLCGY